MTWKTLAMLSISTSVMILLCGCEKKSPTSVVVDESGQAQQTPSTAFTLEDQTGKDVSLDDFKGKVVVLEWVNPECPFVQRHYKNGTMVNLANEYKDRGVVWLAINSTKHFNQEKNREFHEQYNLPFPVLDDHTGVVGKRFQAKTTPQMFVIDKVGQIAYAGAIDDDSSIGGGKGNATENYVKKALDELLAGKAVTTSQTKPYGCSVKYAD